MPTLRDTDPEGRSGASRTGTAQVLVPQLPEITRHTARDALRRGLVRRADNRIYEPRQPSDRQLLRSLDSGQLSAALAPRLANGACSRSRPLGPPRAARPCPIGTVSPSASPEPRLTRESLALINGETADRFVDVNNELQTTARSLEATLKSLRLVTIQAGSRQRSAGPPAPPSSKGNEKRGFRFKLILCIAGLVVLTGVALEKHHLGGYAVFAGVLALAVPVVIWFFKGYQTS